MKLAESLPKMNAPQDVQPCGEADGLLFCGTEETIAEAFRKTGGKVLLVSDETSFSVFASAACRPRAVSAVLQEDCLPLFAMPEVSRVLCTGGKRTLCAARFFADVQKVPCVVFPAEATLCGAAEKRGAVCLGGDTFEADLKTGEICCDMNLLNASLSRAYGRVLLAELEEFESRVLRSFGIPCAARRVPSLSDGGAEALVRANAEIRLCGDGGALCTLLEEDGCKEPEAVAFFQLSSLYAAFFEKGKPRRYFTPDYRARRRAAGTEKTGDLPSVEEYALRAFALERMRAAFTKETRSFLAQKEARRAKLRALSSGGVQESRRQGNGYLRLKYLPEFHEGLCSLIRDFGLMEWDFPKEKREIK